MKDFYGNPTDFNLNPTDLNFGCKISAFNIFVNSAHNGLEISQLMHKICLRLLAYLCSCQFFQMLYIFGKEEQLEKWCNIFDAQYIS